MSQFGGPPREDDYGFFGPTKPSASASQFGVTPRSRLRTPRPFAGNPAFGAPGHTVRLAPAGRDLPAAPGSPARSRRGAKTILVRPGRRRSVGARRTLVPVGGLPDEQGRRHPERPSVVDRSSSDPSTGAARPTRPRPASGPTTRAEGRGRVYGDRGRPRRAHRRARPPRRGRRVERHRRRSGRVDVREEPVRGLARSTQISRVHPDVSATLGVEVA